MNLIVWGDFIEAILNCLKFKLSTAENLETLLLVIVFVVFDYHFDYLTTDLHSIRPGKGLGIPVDSFWSLDYQRELLRRDTHTMSLIVDQRQHKRSPKDAVRWCLLIYLLNINNWSATMVFQWEDEVHFSWNFKENVSLGRYQTLPFAKRPSSFIIVLSLPVLLNKRSREIKYAHLSIAYP